MKTRAPQGILMSFVLFCIALLLVITTAPFGFLYALIRQTCSSKAKSLNVYFVEVALVLDEVGNVTMQHLLNDILLIKNNETISDNKVPWLGDIPWLGHLFSNVKRTDNATNMVVLLTPHIVTSSAEASYLTKEFQKQLQWTPDPLSKPLLPSAH